MKRLLLSAVLLSSMGAYAQVGINTTEPEATLDVNGDVRIQNSASTDLPSHSDCPCFLVIDKQGKVKRVPVGQGSGSGITSGNTGGGGTSNGVSPVDGGVSNPDVLTPAQVLEIGWSTYKSNFSTVELNVNLPDGVPYSAYMSPEVILPTLDGGSRGFRITYPKGTTSGGKIIATLLINGDQTYMPKLRYTTGEEQTDELPLAFNGVEQNAKLVLHSGINIVKNTEHGKTFTYPIVKVGNKYITAINLGAKYAEEATDNPIVLRDWIKKSNWQYDKKAYGSLFQWQRKADGHELIDWDGTSPSGINGVSSQLSDSWTDAMTSKFIKGNSSWVNNTLTGNGPFDLWKSGKPNNPCPSGYHVPSKDEWEYIENTVKAKVTESDDIESALWNDSSIRFVAAGLRSRDKFESYSTYWSNSKKNNNNNESYSLRIYTSASNTNYVNSFVEGASIRCIK